MTENALTSKAGIILAPDDFYSKRLYFERKQMSPTTHSQICSIYLHCGLEYWANVMFM